MEAGVERLASRLVAHSPELGVIEELPCAWPRGS